MVKAYIFIRKETGSNLVSISISFSESTKGNLVISGAHRKQPLFSPTNKVTSSVIDYGANAEERACKP